jgi:long-chain acyl-CoA synthetase
MLNEEAGILVSEKPAFTVVGTIPAVLLHSGDQYAKPDAFKFKRNGQWIDVSTREFLLRVEELFFALRELGLKAGDRVGILSENRLEWAIADYAALCAGAVTVPVYPTLSIQQVEVLLRDAKPVVVFASNPALAEKARAGRSFFRSRLVIAFDPGRYESSVLHLDALYETGRRLSQAKSDEFRYSALAVDPEQLATIIYTSGTTGIPKGAMLTHRNLVSNIRATSERLPLTMSDVNLSFLPLSHIFQRHVDFACLNAGVTIAYAENATTVGDDMMQVRPTFASGVPRFFEKIHDRILAEVSHAPAVQRAIFFKALQIGKDHLLTANHALAQRAADRLVFHQIRARLGGRLRFFISGGAALRKDIAEFFWAIGIPIYEGYGLTETSPVISLNGPGVSRIGTVGRAVGDQQIRIAPDGEILVRGSNVMSSYYRLKKDTAEAIVDGWFHTGDIGELDADGFLTITDRKKDLLVTSSGKNVAPQPIENRLRSIPYLENIVVIGDHRNFISALVVPNRDALAAYARSHNIPFETSDELPGKPEIHKMVMTEIERLQQDLAPYEKIRKIAFLDAEFSVEGGELTPTLKVRRKVVQKKFEAVIDRLYAA